MQIYAHGGFTCPAPGGQERRTLFALTLMILPKISASQLAVRAREFSVIAPAIHWQTISMA